MLIAQRYLPKAGDDLSDKHPGDPVPEAYNWPNLRNYLQNGWLVEVADWQPNDTGDAAAADDIPPAPIVEAAPVPSIAEPLNHTEASAAAEMPSSDLHKAEVPKSPAPEAAPAPKRRSRSRR